jgi:D-alanyl-lipoteichoic acid acyltransferase DltB (MBOAT superfamily)
MLFNSYNFFLFLPLVFILYWFVFGQSLRNQNILLLFASYFFYSCWDYRFLFLLIFSTLLDFVTGSKIEKSESQAKKKFWLWISIGINLGFLGVFKYYDFFVTSFAEAINKIGLQAHPTTLNIILPVGISFYTFHGLSYVIDIYNGKIKAEPDFVNYSVFVSFFPLLVAGPIERATHLLPQIKNKREFQYFQAMNGLRQIVWGLFKKVVVADNCAQYVDAIFPAYQDASPVQLITAIVLFAFQIYGDFSGYSDIALGTAKLFGIELFRNFAYPYFSRDIAEFWRRWHISLSSWFRDYLYIPLGGSKKGISSAIKNTFIIFLVSGFWHGANWTFLFWGLLNALYFIPLLVSGKNRINLRIAAENRVLPSFKELFQILFTFTLCCIAWVFFRSASISDAFLYFKSIFINHGIIKQLSATYSIVSIIILIVFEWYNRRTDIPFLAIKNTRARYFSYATIMALIFLMGAFINPRSFIYFQF